MSRRSILITILVVACAIIAGCGTLSGGKAVVILVSPDASLQETIAAREIQRYVYQRTGTLPEIVAETGKIPKNKDMIVVALKDRPLLREFDKEGGAVSTAEGLASEHYMLKTIRNGKRRALLVIGGDSIGTLYGAYGFAEHIGVRFYLDGDVIPDTKTAFVIPDIDEQAGPLFSIRGIQPFHDFPEGPDWWNADDYKAVLSQLPKLRMNFFGLHCYPEGGVGPEPAVWIGLEEDINDDGSVKFSYPSRWFNTLLGSWGYQAGKTSEFVSGSDVLFESDAYGPDVMRGHTPLPDTPADNNDVFNRAGKELGESFRYARMLGIKTCIGTETPLTIPKTLQEHIKEKGKNPGDIAVVEELYRGMFSRLKKTGEPDYYWFWTPENWIWGGNTQKDIDATKNDLTAAISAAESVNAPFTLATCGWVLGPQSDRALFDTFLPKEMPMSCINRFLGMSPVDNAFESIKGRPAWAIPWMEDDPDLTSPQLWAGRMRADAVGALKYGCSGLIGIHWRTRILGPNVSALAHAAWNQNGFEVTPAEEGPIGENVEEFTAQYNATGKPIKGTADDTLYQTVRSEVSGYRLKVPNGVYSVTLKFSETLHERIGLRIFGVRLQDKPVLNDLDIFAKVGKNTALDYTFDNISVTDGVLFIDFIRKYDYPVIAALDVHNPGFSLKINCGGPAYKDYRADWERAQPRDVAVDDFYADWAQNQFGPEAAEGASRIFGSIDGRLPRPSRWIAGPGSFYADKRTWEEAARDYEFVAEFENLQSVVQGAGNRERFEYWLNNFRYMRAVAQLNCLWGAFDSAMEKVYGEKDTETKAKMARTDALPLYTDMVRKTGEVVGYLLATVNTNGEMGTVANVNTHTLPRLLGETGKKLSEALGVELPADAVPGRTYTGKARLVVPTVRSSVMENEALKLKAIVLDDAAPKTVELYWRPMGEGAFARVELTHVARGVYEVSFSPDIEKSEALEYYISVVANGGENLYFPATAPELNQAVVIIPAK